ncbi:MAG: hypothetical protein WA828_02900 [Coleofasciculaceae cyanobacterium]
MQNRYKHDRISRNTSAKAIATIPVPHNLTARHYMLTKSPDLTQNSHAGGKHP